MLLQERVQGLAQRINNEANVPELLVVKDVATVKHKGRLDHCVIYGLVVVRLQRLRAGYSLSLNM